MSCMGVYMGKPQQGISAVLTSSRKSHKWGHLLEVMAGGLLPVKSGQPPTALIPRSETELAQVHISTADIGNLENV